MKILIINYRYFVSGGPERYMFNVVDLLKSNGHEVIPFSVRYSKNSPSKHDRYFVSALSSEEEVYFKDQSWNAVSFMKTLQRAFYSPEVYESLTSLIKETKPDAALVLHYLRKLSPAVLTALADNKVPFVVRLSDYAMTCPNAHLLRDNIVCELCVGRSILPSVKYKCVQGSLGASLVNYAATQYHHAKGYFDLIPYFITPSKFLQSKMIEAGWEEKRLVHIPTFVDPRSLRIAKKKKDQIVFVGRLDEIKGVSILLEALRILKNRRGEKEFKVLIAGDGTPAYVGILKKFVSDNGLTNVNFLGNVTGEKVLELLSESTVSIVPSVWYENMPNSVLESMACGTPVIASDHGSFPEIVKHGKTGLLFHAGDAVDLAEKIEQLLGDSQLCEKMSGEAVQFIKEYHLPDKHYQKLMELFSTLLNDTSERSPTKERLI